MKQLLYVFLGVMFILQGCVRNHQKNEAFQVSETIDSLEFFLLDCCLQADPAKWEEAIGLADSLLSLPLPPNQRLKVQRFKLDVFYESQRYDEYFKLYGELHSNSPDQLEFVRCWLDSNMVEARKHALAITTRLEKENAIKELDYKHRINNCQQLMDVFMMLDDTNKVYKIVCQLAEIDTVNHAFYSQAMADFESWYDMAHAPIAEEQSRYLDYKRRPLQTTK